MFCVFRPFPTIASPSKTWKSGKTPNATASSPKKSTTCTKWLSFTARNWNRRRKPTSPNQSFLRSFWDQFQRQFSEKIRHREGYLPRDAEASVADSPEAAIESNCNSVLEASKVTTRVLNPESLRQLLEKLTKKFNATCSVNKKIRNEINVFRKERTLYDHVFKNLESLILQEEKKLLGMLKKSNEVALCIKAADENFVNIVETVKKFKNEDFLEIIKEEKSRYDDKMRNASEYGRKSIMANLKNPEKVEELEVNSPSGKSGPSVTVLKPGNHRLSRVNIDQTNQSSKSANAPPVFTPREENEMRILLIEKCVKEFKFITEENSIEVGMQMLAKIDIEKEERQAAMVSLELEVTLPVRSFGKRTENDPKNEQRQRI